MKIQEFHKSMREYFHIQNPGEYLTECLLPLRKVSIDIMRFDDWLHKNVGEYELRGLNMQEALSMSYGTSSALFIKSLL